MNTLLFILLWLPISLLAGSFDEHFGVPFGTWEKGVPVAMSKIPPFLEHMQVHYVYLENESIRKNG